MFEKTFKLKEHNTDVRTELMAGLTTFMTMAYILAVNPQILSVAGMPAGGVLIATALASALACICMAFMANLPFALAPGMGLNAYFAYTVVGQMGYSWQTALFAVLVEGVIFIILSLTPVREAIFDAIPLSLKHAVSAGIGLFIAFIGLQNANLVRGGATLVEFNKFSDAINTAGISAILCLVGVIIIAILSYKKVKGAILIGILGAWILGMLAQVIGLYVPDPAAGFFSLYPSFTLGTHFEEFGTIAGQALNFDAIDLKGIGDFIAILFAFLFVDLFDTLGTLIGVATKADMLDENGKLPKIKGALMADSIGTTAGALLGTSTVTTYVESSAGVAEGGRTGLTALTTGVLFLIAIILSPIFIAIPAFATGAALIYVGFLMLTSLLKVDFEDLTEAIPAYIAVIAMPFFYSIAEGISFGIIFYVIINLLTGKENRKKVSPLMAVLSILFVLRYIFL
ncbi:MAG: NCS2 family permease [Eubacteriales bacterium]|nr:NCS2 family permease [Eubacteriales bacterium]MDD4324086.1 NCS2 family permease [Eubacteriales bacterium]MDD4541232.1 NCS2 family permease [Eubacteriales bacterium]